MDATGAIALGLQSSPREGFEQDVLNAKNENYYKVAYSNIVNANVSDWEAMQYAANELTKPDAGMLEKIIIPELVRQRNERTTLISTLLRLFSESRERVIANIR